MGDCGAKGNQMTNERLPQRFRYQAIRGDRWRHGVAVPHPTDPPTWRIECLNSCGFGGFDSDPWEILGHIIGDVDEFQWIDNDYGWAGDVMVKHDPEASAREMILAAVAHVGPIAAHKFVDEWFTLENAQ